MFYFVLKISKITELATNVSDQGRNHAVKVGGQVGPLMVRESRKGWVLWQWQLQDFRTKSGGAADHVKSWGVSPNLGGGPDPFDPPVVAPLSAMTACEYRDN